MTHLDSNFLIRALIAGSKEATDLQHWITTGETVSISTVAWAEFLCGPLSAQEEAIATRLLPQAQPFMRQDGKKAAELFNLTGRRSRSLADCMIAAVALRCGAKVATVNKADFRPFEPFGLTLA